MYENLFSSKQKLNFKDPLSIKNEENLITFVEEKLTI